MSPHQQLRDLLLTYLAQIRVLPWPGADGLTIEDALLSYPAAAADGKVPDQDELLLDHPELAVETEEFFKAPGRWLRRQEA